MTVAEGVVLPVPEVFDAHEDAEVILGVRPDHIRFEDSGAAATVVVMEPMGFETHDIMDLGGRSIVAASRERLVAGPGATLNMRPNADKALIFDAASGDRIYPGVRERMHGQEPVSAVVRPQADGGRWPHPSVPHHIVPRASA